MVRTGWRLGVHQFDDKQVALFGRQLHQRFANLCQQIAALVAHHQAEGLNRSEVNARIQSRSLPASFARTGKKLLRQAARLVA
jgi:hypothetical protein